ncbi:MAG: hypothetical protein ACHQE5_05595, partial [Actinomycetes bacterium]
PAAAPAPEPPRRTSRALLATAGVALLVLVLVGAVLVNGALTRRSTTTALPRPGVSAPAATVSGCPHSGETQSASGA